MRFRDRRQAGSALAARLDHLRDLDPVVLGLPRGGVPVAAEIADAIGATLDIILVRKLGVPRQSEWAMGAIGEGGVVVLNEDVIETAGVAPGELAAVQRRERDELDRRREIYRGDTAPVPLTGRCVIVVDDGIATGATAHAALEVVAAHRPDRVVLAAPVAPPQVVERFGPLVDELVIGVTPPRLSSVGSWYDDFAPVADEEVVALLHRARRSRRAAARPVRTDVGIDLGGVTLPGHLDVPEHSIGIAVFAHGSGSSRLSPRNREVAADLRQHGIGTLLFDLLSETEARDRSAVFDIELLAGRLANTTRWLRRRDDVGRLPVGYFGASTGAAAALWAAADPDSGVAAVVSRGGRPDLAAEHLGDVRAPTLLVVGGHDTAVLGLNRRAARALRCPHSVVVVPGATHLFEEPGTLGQVSELAAEWFGRYLPAAACHRPAG